MDPTGKLRLDVVKPDGPVLSELVDECIVPGARGYFGVRPGHAPLLAVLGVGELMYRRGPARGYVAVAGGFCEVGPDRVSVLAEVAERGEQIDVPRATRARDRAREHLQSLLGTTEAEAIEQAQADLARAEVRLAAAGRRSAPAAPAHD